MAKTKSIKVENPDRVGMQVKTPKIADADEFIWHGKAKQGTLFGKVAKPKGQTRLVPIKRGIR